MNILVNGKHMTVAKSTLVSQLLEQLHVENTRFAIEINDQIVPRSTYNQHPLQAEDKIEIVEAIGGG